MLLKQVINHKISQKEEDDTCPRKRRVYISHGKNRSLLDTLKEIIKLGGYEPLLSIEEVSVSKPIPQKIIQEMRSCHAAIVHVDAETFRMSLSDRIAAFIESMLMKTNLMEYRESDKRINQNVLIEIGVAMALYKGNFILLVKRGTKLPSNLQGLFECRYEEYDSVKLDSEATIKLLKAVNSFEF